ncbi:rhamnan synthesis F family protein [Acetatifactor muris]|uniref:Rhamnan synthesis protein F n=1 Tax=Acetatifactor muris TaxID=879566 RepID=A0A2K4ZAM5_9FIRM|nr:rhamnan synthesis F family protein [Acetatifactor muris]MCR2048723.1 rhamnan synthesis F family protein [Acetatifactor muris]SOY27516.1 Rhamnan synthesis protein F [Acetatifactor muris]
MKRLGIIVLFDSSGNVDNYIKVLLSSLQSELHEILIVINGYMDNNSLKILYNYTDMVFCRENIGFDAGAYKDVFLHFFGRDRYEMYDEIILMNDTIFGPLSSLKMLFERFEAENVDFWGLTKHPEKVCNNGKVIESHIQAYFLVIRKTLFTDSLFETFWRELDYPQSYEMAVRNFEIKFTVFFTEKGFQGNSLMELYQGLLWEKENPYLLHSYELIKELKVPFFKKKCLQFQNEGYINALKTLEYIEKEDKYDTSLIWDNIYRLCREKKYLSVLDYADLDKFYAVHNRIFIYGNGKYGQKMEKYFRYRNWTFECFLSSEITDTFVNCCKYSEIDFNSDDGVILALGKAAFAEVYPVVRERMDDTQMFILRYE